MRISTLLVGPGNTGKTTSIKNLLDHEYIASDIGLYSYTTTVENTKVHMTIWDTSSKIEDLDTHILMNTINICIIFCDLVNTSSCQSLGKWKDTVTAYNTNIQIIVAGTYLNDKLDRYSKLINKNKILVLEWCVQNGDIPFFEINNLETDNMYNNIIRSRILNLE
jgi:GTPase SAR1 family protein